MNYESRRVDASRCELVMKALTHLLLRVLVDAAAEPDRMVDAQSAEGTGEKNVAGHRSHLRQTTYRAADRRSKTIAVNMFEHWGWLLHHAVDTGPRIEVGGAQSAPWV